ncbi:hypothetical protein [Streptomyces fulvoviolaceus]|uniref:hypothetical protein n=1 Tax=Streptomyces fulvoviolaceus TaxID=285535 RepID=UPI0021C24C15|nr:hypothetical protein [Streptomyces fulvoviolaceus]MCT9075133.1 hypothetical protein [Streptomyces fulvoviolaceus]
MVVQVSEARMPGSVKGALVGAWLQGVANFFASSYYLTLVTDRLDHNQDVPHLGLARFALYMSLVASVVLLVSGVFARKRFDWVRITVLVVECMALPFALINVFVVGVPAAVIGLVLPALIAKTMLGAPARAWFHR